jgi:hypothetical protein
MGQKMLRNRSGKRDTKRKINLVYCSLNSLLISFISSVLWSATPATSLARFMVLAGFRTGDSVLMVSMVMGPPPPPPWGGLRSGESEPPVKKMRKTKTMPTAIPPTIKMSLVRLEEESASRPSGPGEVGGAGFFPNLKL